MAINLQNLESTRQRWNAPSEDYPQGSYKNGSAKGLREGSYMTAEAMNDILGFFGAILKSRGVTPNGQTETARNSQIFNALVEVMQEQVATKGGIPVAVASGGVNAITASFTKNVVLENGFKVYVRAIGANTSETVTFNPNGLGAKRVYKDSGKALASGDIAGVGFWMELIYDAISDAWNLQNPAGGAYSYVQQEDIVDTLLAVQEELGM